MRAADVAKAAGTSTSAVSRAFRPDSPISPELRNRILASARELGYVNPHLKLSKVTNFNSISVVAGDLSNPFYPLATERFARAISAQGGRMILHTVPPGSDVDAVMNQVLEFRSSAAIIMTSSMSSMLVKACRNANLPVVLFNRIQPDNRMTAVTCDNYGGGRMVAEYFIKKGFRSIGMIGGRINTSTHLERARGLQDRLGEAGIKIDYFAHGDFDYQVSYAAVAQMLAGKIRPEALFCINDIMGFAAIDAARDHGLRCPEDLAVMGFDDIPMAAWASYQMSSVRQPIDQMVQDTLQMINDMIADPKRQGSIRIAPVELVLRESA
ncbi:LacI family DNA-binding transcriptional regulator [Falsigemmobacter intermedius]|uniref:LacI family DNA-binding transcriptional regulator n=1 Tax=Falsigemmobacter intermedius TaxID=1553448 RepID=A0A451GGI8_9RHOB|nr:LacI family DNA-binding transcriptional regulator [Falsigemmobacter intermedius]